LTLKTCGFGVTDKFVRELARSCTALSELEIKRADLTLSSLCFLLTDCGFMRNLRLEDCSFLPTAGDIVHDRYGCMRMLRLSNIDISEEELGDLLEACPDLTELEVSNCQELLHSDILPIGSSCRRLEKFSMMGNVLFASDEMFEELGENCPHLRVLEIAHFHFVTATGLAAVARGCPALECVDIRGCRQVGDDFLTALAQGCPELKVLLLFECVLITYQGLRVVMAGCPCLVELGVDSDGVLTEEEVLAIKACYPKTREDA
jgi:F-box/leucine-rich repeat protein 2/20